MTFEFVDVTCALLIPGILLASWYDYTQRRVPNWLNLALILTGFAVQGLFFGLSGLSMAFWGMLTGFGLLIIPWLMRGMGAGDVKLMAAIGTWLGARLTLYSFSLGVMIGGVVAIIMILSSGRLQSACKNMGVILAKCSNPKTMFSDFGSVKSFGKTTQLLPYGVPLTMGTLFILFNEMYGWWGM